MLSAYLRGLYERTMREAYGRARGEIVNVIDKGGRCLECGAYNGYEYQQLRHQLGGNGFDYRGVEWNLPLVEQAQAQGLDIIQGDLNQPLTFEPESFRCVYALSVLEHLFNPCRFLKECHRVLERDGRLILLTPNISTYFTAALILAGKMPSSGPHPDSNRLLETQMPLARAADEEQPDIVSDTPVHRHLVVFSYRALRRYLAMIGFREIHGYGFGLYPFPNFLQKPLERIDPYHCHQMVFVASK